MDETAATKITKEDNSEGDLSKSDFLSTDFKMLKC